MLGLVYLERKRGDEMRVREVEVESQSRDYYTSYYVSLIMSEGSGSSYFIGFFFFLVRILHQFIVSFVCDMKL